MVKAASRFLLLASITHLVLSSSLAKPLAEYQIGDAADEDIVAPVQLTIVDPDATEVLKQKEAQQVPVVFRYDTSAADEAGTAFRNSFLATRSNLLQTVERSFGKRTLSSGELESDGFYQLAVTFTKQNRLFPLSTNRATLWASGDSDEGYLESMAASLRQAMKVPIQPDNLPIELRSAATIRIVPLTGPAEVLTVAIAEQRGTNISRSTLVTLANVRRDLQNLFLADERAAGRYLSSFVKANCQLDEDVTAQMRAKRTEGLWAKTRYEPGQVIAKRGQVIDAKTKAAIDHLKETVAVGQLQQMIAREQSQAPSSPTPRPAPTQAAAIESGPMYWLIGILAAVVFLLTLAVWHLARRRQPATLLPARIGDTAVGPEGNPLSWQERALIAEGRVQEVQQAVRSGLIAQLTRWLSDKLVHGLISQRRQLLDTHQKAAQEMAELEARLEKIHAPLQERLLTYERRIAELEKELAAKGEENRELIKAKIELARKQLEIERGKNRVEFN